MLESTYGYKFLSFEIGISKCSLNSIEPVEMCQLIQLPLTKDYLMSLNRDCNDQEDGWEEEFGRSK